jgi:hypothetical protein
MQVFFVVLIVLLSGNEHFGFERDRFLYDLSAGVSASELLSTRDDFVDLSQHPNVALFPRIPSRLPWSIGVSSLGSFEFVGWTARVMGPDMAPREVQARRLQDGFVILTPDNLCLERVSQVQIIPHRVRQTGASILNLAWWIERAGRRFGGFDRIEWISLSPGGRHMAFVGRNGQDVRLNVFGHSDRYRQVDRLVFSPDGRSYAACVMNGSYWQVVLDGQAQGEWSQVGWPVFSPHGKRLAYSVTSGVNDQRMVVDGKAGQAYGGVGLPVFSADSSQVAYGAKKGSEEFVVVEQREQKKRFSRVRYVTFGPVGRSLAFVGKQGHLESLILDGKPSKEYLEVGRPVLAESKGKTLFAYRARQGMNWVMVHNGREDRRFVQVGQPVFGPQGRHLAFAAYRDQKWHVVVSKKISQAFDWVSTPTFSLDGRKVGFGALSGSKMWWRVMAVD